MRELQQILRPSLSLSLLLALLLWGCSLGLAAAPGQPPQIPDERYQDLQGNWHNLREWQGKVVILNFWATWCAPCQYEIKDFVRYQASYGDAGLQIIGLGMDEARRLKNVKRSLEINYPVLQADPKNTRELLASWGNRRGTIPYSVIFDRQGRVVRAHMGIIDDQLFGRLILPLLEKGG
ncbi:Peroxiredoxin [endosymbiont of Ridgeia piscesae]|jgi:peroxiredoxin|uniref:Peroxiredoxin n=2 Tax=endosymbiont of Ridgeia piscesae TaxID=54398 RepID=A0A0T5YVR6_9GAMM|nr:TlpA disulfide reductase family protein [endosymbiont of Ridgeia piscesae]KRT54591.1 Peroxiredoxin [endosymbiont of Ridgeia piscesae]